MAKKLSLLLAAVAVLAFAVPAFASAAPTLQTPGGEILKTPQAIKGTGTNVTLTSSTLGKIICGSLNLNGTLNVNTVAAGIEGSGVNEKPEQSNCLNGTKSVIVTGVTLTNLKSTVGGTATASFTATVDIAALECTFTGTNIGGTYTNGGNTLSFSEAGTITSSPAACGTAKLDASFVLEKANGEAIKAVF